MTFGFPNRDERTLFHPVMARRARAGLARTEQDPVFGVELVNRLVLAGAFGRRTSSRLNRVQKSFAVRRTAVGLEAFARQPGWRPTPTANFFPTGKNLPGVSKLESAEFSRLAVKPSSLVLARSPSAGCIGPPPDQRSWGSSLAADQNTPTG